MCFPALQPCATCISAFSVPCVSKHIVAYAKYVHVYMCMCVLSRGCSLVQSCAGQPRRFQLTACISQQVLLTFHLVQTSQCNIMVSSALIHRKEKRVQAFK